MQYVESNLLCVSIYVINNNALHNFIIYRVEIPASVTDSASISSITPSSNKYNVLDDGTLMIQNASGEDEGEYECMARNAVGEAITRAVSLRYFGAPSKFNFALFALVEWLELVLLHIF